MRLASFALGVEKDISYCQSGGAHLHDGCDSLISQKDFSTALQEGTRVPAVILFNWAPGFGY